MVFFLSFFAILISVFNSQALGTAGLVFLAFFGLLMALINANMPAQAVQTRWGDARSAPHNPWA
ncbi:hypothetical protein [Comamonas serinivorans]|uniref:hypothetical protein n=1 Tax=Comamonas serinivorans TaxID=1082851 RepID=UPI001F31295F|nr:hypothetical protein [Comamonas serinivorans]